ncbi:MAG: Fe-S cluster assembly protein SufB, partial [Nanoarchaeota archaeon]
MDEEFLINREKLDHRNPERAVLKAPEGLTEETVRLISSDKNEPEWMLQKRLQSFKFFKERLMPAWGPSLEKLDLSKITYYIRPDEKGNATRWEDVPDDIKNTFEKLGIPEVER